MKIRKCDLPKKDFSCENIMYSLAKAINNHREGNYMDCGFENESDFSDYLLALEEKGVIRKKQLYDNKRIDLSNYIYVINSLLNFNDKRKFLKWISENIIGSLSIVLATTVTPPSPIL